MFSQTNILEVYPPIYSFGSLFLSWRSNAVPGTMYQIYLDDNLAWSGTSTQAAVPWPSGEVSISIGTVGAGEQFTNFSSSLYSIPDNIVELSWVGGTFLDAEIAGFYVYGPDTANGPVDYSAPLANIPAYPGNIILDGYGLGPYGFGAWSESASVYSWFSQPLYTGNWTYSVAAYDNAGNLSPYQTVSVFIGVPPRECPVFSDLKRLHYSLILVAGLTWNQNGYGDNVWPGYEAVLTWLPSLG